MSNKRLYKHQRQYLRRMKQLCRCTSVEERIINKLWLEMISYQYRVVEHKLLFNTLHWGNQYFMTEYPKAFNE